MRLGHTHNIMPYLILFTLSFIAVVFICTRDMDQEYLGAPVHLKVTLALLGCVLQIRRLKSPSHYTTADQRHDIVIQNRGRPLPEDAVPLLPEDYQWPPGLPQPWREEEREQESRQDEMVPIEQVYRFLENIREQQEEQEQQEQQEQQGQDVVEVPEIPVMSKAVSLILCCSIFGAHMIVHCHSVLDKKPKLLHLLKLQAEGGKEVKILNQVAWKFEEVAYALEFEPGDCRAVLRTTNHDYHKACLKIFEKWLDGEGRKPVTWATLIQALEDADLKEVARELKNTVRRDVMDTL